MLSAEEAHVRSHFSPSSIQLMRASGNASSSTAPALARWSPSPAFTFGRVLPYPSGMTGATLPRPPRPPEPANEEERSYIPRDGDSRRKFARLRSTAPVTLDNAPVATQSMLGNFPEPSVLSQLGVQGYIPSRGQQDLGASGRGSVPWTVTTASAHPHLAVYDVDYPPINEMVAHAGIFPRIETANPPSRSFEPLPTSSVTPHLNGAGIRTYVELSSAGCEPPIYPATAAVASASNSFFALRPSASEADFQAGYPHRPRSHPDSPSTSALSSSTYPVNVSTPFIPPQSPIPHPIVVNTAANRRRLGSIDLTGRTRQESVSRRTSTSQSSRRVVELATECQACRRAIGRLALRGGTVDEQDGDSASYSATFYCSSCVPIPAELGSVAGPGEFAAPLSIDPYIGECTYLDNLSAAVDRYLGEDPDAQDARPPPAPPGKVRTGFLPHDASPVLNKKRRSSVIDDVEGVLACQLGSLLSLSFPLIQLTARSIIRRCVPTGYRFGCFKTGGNGRTSRRFYRGLLRALRVPLHSLLRLRRRWRPERRWALALQGNVVRRFASFRMLENLF